MKKIIMMIMLMFSATAWSADPAIEFMDALATDVIERGLQGNKTIQQKEEFVREKFTTVLDLKSISQFVLGTYAKKASDADKQDFIQAFTNLPTKTWTDRFSLYNGQKIVFTGTRNAQKKQLYVDSFIQENPPVEVIWRVRPKDKAYVVIDIIIEGVSMAQSYRSEYTTFIQQHQGDIRALISELQNKADHFKYGEVQKN